MVSSLDVFEAIKTRRSIRRFKEDSVPDTLIRRILDAARQAPSGDNSQPWIFILVKDSHIKQKIRAFLADRARRYIQSDEGKRELQKYGPDTSAKWIKAIEAGRYQEHIAKSSVLIVTAGDTGSPYYVHDCCAATMNLILAAQAVGLGSCWIDHGVSDELTESSIRDVLRIPKDYRIVSLVAIGFPAEAPKPRPRKEIRAISFLDIYGKKWV